MMKLKTNSEAETRALGKNLGAKLKGGEILALAGNLGSGKTTFVKGLARGLGLRKKIKSPTFVIFQPYRIPDKKQGMFYHFDLYRLGSVKDLRELGFQEIISSAQNISVIEWPEKTKKKLPKRTIYLKFIHGRKENQRIITFYA